ncbi:excinuclease ABC subunit UvrA [Archangium violaceum]|uniref:ATP-binding cassette domain-containing protein n=1 Tax=Archangium violaceum TaxID=83451 RepID=UPI00193C2FE4|nr:excinuclease ABC subunit UvrA [Archangium violaceum]QRK05721.1 excinuclease ABC subunit UvrA [Archangium violaceum]
MPTDVEHIEIRGARENNLREVNLRIPKRKITLFTGVSGSGKSSIVFDTIAAEAQRQLFENFSLFVRNFLPKVPQPAADAIENLNMAVIVDQKRLGGGSHSTVGTATDINPLLRLLFSRVGQPHVGYSNQFSFNEPQGMCPECNGIGQKLGVRADGFLDMSKSLAEGAVQVPVFAKWENGMYAASGFFDVNKKLSEFTKEEMDLLLYASPRKFKAKFNGNDMNATYMGIIEKFTRAYIKRDLKTLSPRTQKAVTPYLTMGPCPLCKGARLSQAALGCRIQGKNIAELTAMEVDELLPWVKALEGAAEAPLAKALAERLGHVVDIGLGYLSLDRPTDTLSGGESQRIKMVKHLGSSLVEVLYIFDEPSVGLHPRDVYRLGALLRALRDKGNTVLVVEHDPDVIKIADHVVDVGPHAGRKGGTVVFEGSYENLLKSKTLTGQYLERQLPLKETPRQPKGRLPIRNARVNNLKDVSVDIPSGVLTVVTGVAGSGKSSLIHEVFVPTTPGAVVIDQSAVGTSSRSTPATYTGVMDDLRKELADANDVDASLFSFNSKGACETCNGLGVLYTDLAFLEGVKTPCETCHGKRFKDEVLEYKLEGRSISDYLALNVTEALAALGSGKGAKKRVPLLRKLEAMRDVGLDYLTLGQPLNTLSGGECQRIKLATELHKKGSVYVLDEPTTGLHMSDISLLMKIIDRLVDEGNTAVVIEHNLDVIRSADWVIDLGPDGGSKGGEVVFEGPSAELLKAKSSLTGAALRGEF